MKTYIIGHQKPDTDAVVATLAFKHLFDSIECWNHSNSVATITHKLNPETTFIFNKFKQAHPFLITTKNIMPEDKVVLVDHNETTQMLNGLNQDQITDIFDHHKINLNLNHSIFMIIKPWGSTCTIAWHLIDLYQLNIPKKLAALMLSAILSDTVGFKSSTTTTIDKKAAIVLAKTAQLNINQFTFEVLQAKSNLTGLSDQQIITKDYKIYDFNGQKVFINQVETVEQENLIKTKKELLLKALKTYKKQEGYHLAFVALTDILKLNTKLLLPSNLEIKLAEKSFDGKVKNNLLDIGQKLSRKKDIAPAIERNLL